MTLKILALLVCLMGLGYGIPGVRLLFTGGSGYYAAMGLLLVISGVSLWRKRMLGLWLYAAGVLGSLGWAQWESGGMFWGLSARLALLGFLGLALLLPGVRRPLNPAPRQGVSAANVLLASLMLTLVSTAFAYVRLMNSLSIDPEHFASVPRQVSDTTYNRTDWLAYGNSRKGTRFSPATQFTKNNVSQLKLAWTARTGVGATFKNTPLQVGEHLYACAAGNVIIALNASTGDERWRFDPKINKSILDRLSYFTTTCRGVSFYEAPATYQGECPRRLLMGTTDARLLAVNADSGEACSEFGDNGQIDLTHKLGEVKTLFYFVTSAPAIVRGNAVVGGWVMDNVEVKEPSGVIRAFNAITGEFAWAWDMGRPGMTSEPTGAEGDEIYTRGTPNVWSLFSVDEERSLVYAPLGNETPDYFGGLRHEASEQFASAIVAIHGDSGNLAWSFQTVHHDIWDYDVPAQPSLVDIPDANGNLVPAVVQVTKRGQVFLLNRETGAPLAAVTEQPVPQGGVPEDWTAPTQPYSALPNVLEKQITEADMWGATVFDQLWCRLAFQRLRYEGDFTPPSTRPSLQYPGNAGGYNWGAVSVHEGHHIMVGNVLTLGNTTRLVPRAEMDAGARGSPQYGTPYGAQSRRFSSPLGLPCTQPPFGKLVAIDLQHRRLLWQRSIGTAEEQLGVPLEIGVPAVTGGSMVTSTGLVFFAATMDRNLRALDLHTGAELWRFKLPQSSQGTPITYIAPQTGRQMLIVTAPERGGRPGAKSPPTDGLGGHILAFELPADR